MCVCVCTHLSVCVKHLCLCVRLPFCCLRESVLTIKRDWECVCVCVCARLSAKNKPFVSGKSSREVEREDNLYQSDVTLISPLWQHRGTQDAVSPASQDRWCQETFLFQTENKSSEKKNACRTSEVSDSTDGDVVKLWFKPQKFSMYPVNNSFAQLQHHRGTSADL